MDIGMIVAIPAEVDALLKTCGTPLGTDEVPGYTVYRYEIAGNRVFAVGSGAGEISAAAAVQFLITKYGVQRIVNFGVVGGLTEEMGLCRTAVVEKAVHYDFDASPFDGSMPGQYMQFPDVYIPAFPELVRLALETEPSLKPAVIASADRFVEDRALKARLRGQYGADICDMESAGILLTAHRNKVPALLIKAVSDSAGGDANEFAKTLHVSAETCVKVLLKILRAA